MINLISLYCHLQKTRNTQRIFDDTYQYDPTIYTERTKNNLTYDRHDITVNLWCQQEVQKKVPEKGL